jgi:hypothetical protein
MRSLAFLILAAGLSSAQTVEEAIAKALEFTAAGERDWARVRPSMTLPQYPMSEMSIPVLVAGKIRSVTPRWALVEGSIRVFGSLIVMQQTPVLMVLKRDGDRWLVDWIWDYRY